MENTVQWLKIQHDGQSRGVRNLTKGGITTNCVDNTSVDNSKVVLDVCWYFSSLLAALFYSMHFYWNPSTYMASPHR